MPNYDFIVPITYIAQDNDTFITKRYFSISDCDKFTKLSGLCNGYNFNKCPNDNAYQQPYIKGDLIYFQVFVNASKYQIGNPSISLIDSNGTLFTGFSWTYGTDVKKNNSFITFVINTGDYPVFENSSPCWYVKIALFDGSDYDDFITSEPYREVKCDESTVLIKGKYTDYDCDGNYYGEFDTELENTFIPQFRIPAIIEPVGNTFVKTKNSTKVVKSKQTQNFLFRTEKVPYFVAKQIALAFNSEEFSADGVVYNGSLKLDKDFDEGSEWIINETISIDCDEINFTCNS